MGVSLAAPHPSLLSSTSDYVIDDKVAILQKRDHEGFGFVLRGAKGNEGLGAGVSGWQRLQTVPGFCSAPLRSYLPLLLPPVSPHPLSRPYSSLSLCCDCTLGLECLSTGQGLLLLVDVQDCCSSVLDPVGASLVGVRGEFLRGMYPGFPNWLLSWLSTCPLPSPERSAWFRLFSMLHHSWAVTM